MGRIWTEEQKKKKGEARSNKIPKVKKYLQINDNYRVTADDSGYVIEKRNDAGNWKEAGYHSRIEWVFDSLCEHQCRDNIDDLRLVANMIGDIREIVLQLKTL